MPVTAIFAILPDLLDKPIGHILYAGTLNNGRLFFHSLLGIASLLAIAIILIVLFRAKADYHWVIPALFGGVLSHQILDRLWNKPVTWYYPLFGPFQHDNNPDYFMHSILAELTCPTEWLFAISCVIIAAAWYREYFPGPPRIFRLLCNNRNFLVIGLGLTIAGFWSLGSGFLRTVNPLAPTLAPEDTLILALILFWGAVSFLLLRKGFFLTRHGCNVPELNTEGSLGKNS